MVSVQALLELGRAHLALLDQDGMRSVLDQIHGILQQRPQLGTLVTATQELEEHLSHLANAAPFAASSLTPAELRLVPLLSTRMTMAEMGETLFVSRNTVKTHAIAVYRKLGVSSRNEAVERLAELGLLARTRCRRSAEAPQRTHPERVLSPRVGASILRACPKRLRVLAGRCLPDRRPSSAWAPWSARGSSPSSVRRVR